MLTAVLFASISAFHATPVDTFPPGGRLLSPLPRSVIATNTIRLAAEAWDGNGSGIKEVAFEVLYMTHADTIDFQNRMRDTVRLFAPPWERVFDISTVPDQDFWRTGFNCTVTDSAGLSTLYHSENVVIDRNPELSPVTLTAGHAKHRPRIDGSLGEWPDPWVRFRNNDNTVRAAAMWDRRFLYVAIDVADQSVCSRGRSQELFLDDCIELFFDVNYDRAEVRDLDDKQFFVSPSGRLEGWTVDLRPVIRVIDATLGATVQSAVRIHGTINHVTDGDTGYTAEVAIPWTALGANPRRGLRMGFDVFNTDREDTAGVRLGVSWMGNERYRNNNPSEWGNLELAGASVWPIAVGAGSLVVLLALAVAVARRKSRLEAGKPVPSSAQAPDAQFAASGPSVEPGHAAVVQACAYIKEHYSDDDLSLEKVARSVGLNAQYLSRIFKKDSGTAFAAFVNSVRMTKARELLAEPNLTVSEVAVRVGYGTLSNFEKVFKKAEGVTPRQYRGRSA